MFRSRGEASGMGEDLCTSCSNTSWLETESRLRLVAGLSDSLFMDSVSELRRIGDRMLAPREVRSCELVMAIKRSLQGEEVVWRAGGLVLEAGR